MQRYFLQFNYLGTRFKGLQKQLFRQEIKNLSKAEMSAMYEKDEITVQGALESAVWNTIRPPNPVKINSSSRTDKGVHAIVNTAHVDLCPRPTGSYVAPREITKQVNAWMMKKNFDIRVRKTLAVPPEFNSRRNVSSRSYLYKLAVVPSDLKCGNEMFHSWSAAPFNTKYKRSKARSYNTCVKSKLSVLEQERYYEISSYSENPFNIEKFKQTLSLMEGEHNFSNFSKAEGHFKYISVAGVKYTKVAKTPLEMTKIVHNIEVLIQPPPLPASIYPAYEENGITFLDVVIQGQSFLHNQVRRMVGAAVAVAQGKTELEEVAEMLKNPESSDWSSTKCLIAPPTGLYLAKIDYKEGVLDLATESSEDLHHMGKVQLWPSDDPSEFVKSESDDDILVPNDIDGFGKFI